MRQAFSPFYEWIHSEFVEDWLEGKELTAFLRLDPSERFRSCLGLSGGSVRGRDDGASHRTSFALIVARGSFKTCRGAPLRGAQVIGLAEDSEILGAGDGKPAMAVQGK